MSLLVAPGASAENPTISVPQVVPAAEGIAGGLAAAAGDGLPAHQAAMLAAAGALAAAAASCAGDPASADPVACRAAVTAARAATVQALEATRLLASATAGQAASAAVAYADDEARIKEEETNDVNAAMVELLSVTQGLTVMLVQVTLETFCTLEEVPVGSTDARRACGADTSVGNTADGSDSIYGATLGLIEAVDLTATCVSLSPVVETLTGDEPDCGGVPSGSDATALMPPSLFADLGPVHGAAERGPDGSVTYYTDADGDGQRDPGEAVASTPSVVPCAEPDVGAVAGGASGCVHACPPESGGIQVGSTGACFPPASACDASAWPESLGVQGGPAGQCVPAPCPGPWSGTGGELGAACGAPVQDPTATGDADGDWVQDALEPSLCANENPNLLSEGHCDGGDYVPPTAGDVVSDVLWLVTGERP